LPNSSFKDFPFDTAYSLSLGEQVVKPLVEHYFRVKTLGLENIPDPHGPRPLIFIANHAGRTFPWDAVLLDYCVGMHLIDNCGVPVSHKPRSLAAPELSKSPRLLPFRLPNWWRAVGCVDATALNFSRLLRKGQHIIVFPEGIPGIARDYKDRYKLLPFPVALARLAKQYNALIVPIAIIGSEYFHPFARRVGWLHKFGEKVLKIPFLPLSPISVWLPFAPWLFYGALPYPVTLQIGLPLEPEAPAPGEDWEIVTERLRHQLQTLVNDARATHEHGFDLPGLLKAFRNSPEPFWRLLPTYWARRFIRHARIHAPHLFPKTAPDWWFWLPFVGWLNFEQSSVPEGNSDEFREKRLNPDTLIMRS
jgi:1-acyl-sn-glycerol-3-phosphate acyltransferase